MLKENIQDALNKQINAEFYSSYLYLSMSTYFESTNLSGFANWMRIQAQEELTHAIKIYDFVNEPGGKVTLTAIETPQTDWATSLAAFEDAYQHEQKITGWINDLVDLAVNERDHATNNFLKWFVDEQVEEEASAEGVLQKLKLIGDSGSGLFMMDHELGQRVFTPDSSQSNG
ncbi:MAG: ferritin [Halanaerobiales bacterium]|nr:ferritin [Halanaerobiales bacterium]